MNNADVKQRGQTTSGKFSSVENNLVKKLSKTDALVPQQ